MFSSNKPKIAVDFDGTIVDSRYPKIGPKRLFAFETLKRLQDKGYLLILWTYRHGKELDEAVEFCKENGVEFYAVNASFPGEQFDRKNYSRKIDADIFIDDRNIGGMKDWGEIYHLITEEMMEASKPKKGLLGRLFNS
jgi:hydroxymethylpyrimidine pyrophosphatase-like HAD family hydrolase